MAKGKHAAALFEVIHAGKRSADRDTAAWLLRTPKWWFKGRKKPSDPTQSASPPTADAPSAPDAGQSPSPAPRPPAVDVLLDSDRQQITFRVSYTSAIVTGFAVLVVVALAYLLGRNMARGPAQALGGPSTVEIRQGPARPDVMDLRGSGASRATPRQSPAVPDESASVAPPTGVLQPGIASTSPPGRRIAGLNYVVIQSYPDEASAKAAVDILQQHGVGCTVEKGLRGLKSDWSIVVGTDGFAKVSGREYETYIKKIEQISDKFASRKSFKAFQPFGYKWDRP